MNSERMQHWKALLAKNESAYQKELNRMDEREKWYGGEYTFEQMTARTDKLTGQTVKYVYNVIAENIEAQVSNDIPMPKVTARRPQDERLAVIIENMLRNELDRLQMERVNDLSERVVPIQGAGLYMTEWDNTKRTHNTVGEVAVSFIHPKLLIPQAGVYDEIEKMDYFFLKVPTTKEAVQARYGVDVSDEAESEPDVKSSGNESAAEGMVTQYVAYYRNVNGGIGKYSWVNDTELEDLEDYQARRLCRCGKCGTPEPVEGAVFADGDGKPEEWHAGDPCPTCGAAEWTEGEEEFEEVTGPIQRSDGSLLFEEEPEVMILEEPGLPPVEAEVIAVEAEDGIRKGETVRVPYYKPNLYPVVIQRNVSVFGRFLGESDADKMKPLQDGLNRMNQKILDRFLKAGTKIGLPGNASLSVDTTDENVWRFQDVADMNMVRAFNFVGDVSQEMAQVQAIYQQMRQLIGVTDSFQGRKDTTATSGTAKQFAAAQAAGRLESKRVQKEAAYAELFERMFRLRLAYADEPRPVVYQDGKGDTVYDEFNRWDFLEKDEAGHLWWNDQFLFSCDPTAPLASNRERLWQETSAFFQSGAFGDPADPETRLEYWRKMELLHYPGAGETRKNIQERMEQEQAAPAPEPVPEGPSEADIEEMARQAAMQDAGMMM